MEGEFKVRAVEFEEKSAVEIEEKLLKEHEEKLNPTSEPQEQVNIAEVPEVDIDENKIISEGLMDNIINIFLRSNFNN